MAALAPEMHADGRRAEPLRDHGRQQVLSGVLLHVIEPAGPVHDARQPIAAGRRRQQVGDALALVHDVHHLDAAQVAGVERLATGGGIESGAVEVDAAAVLGPLHDGGLERGQVRVMVVDALGHPRNCTWHLPAPWYRSSYWAAAPGTGMGLTRRAATFGGLRWHRRPRSPRTGESAVRTPWRMTVHSIEACNCRPGCNCQFTGFPDNGNCEALIGGEVQEGHYGEVSLAGVRYVIAFIYPGAIHEGNGDVAVFIDERRDPEAGGGHRR